MNMHVIYCSSDSCLIENLEHCRNDFENDLKSLHCPDDFNFKIIEMNHYYFLF